MRERDEGTKGQRDEGEDPFVLAELIIRTARKARNDRDVTPVPHLAIVDYDRADEALALWRVLHRYKCGVTMDLVPGCEVKGTMRAGLLFMTESTP